MRRAVVCLDVLAPRPPTLWERVRARLAGKPPASPLLRRVPATVLVRRRRDAAAVTLYADASSRLCVPNPVELDGRRAIEVWASAPAELELVVYAPGMVSYVETVRLA